MFDFIETGLSIARPGFDRLGSQPVLTFRSAPGGSALKRVIDIVGSGIGLILLSPLFLVAAIAISNQAQLAWTSLLFPTARIILIVLKYDAASIGCRNRHRTGSSRSAGTHVHLPTSECEK
jgi:hypothetical protein